MVILINTLKLINIYNNRMNKNFRGKIISKENTSYKCLPLAMLVLLLE